MDRFHLKKINRWKLYESNAFKCKQVNSSEKLHVNGDQIFGCEIVRQHIKLSAKGVL